MVRDAGWALGVAVMALSLSAGCAEPPPDAEARLAALEAEGQQMDAALDNVEERLLGNQARVHLWQELEERHKQVSAMHCKHADGNVEAILEHEERQEEKARKLKRRHSGLGGLHGAHLGQRRGRAARTERRSGSDVASGPEPSVSSWDAASASPLPSDRGAAGQAVRSVTRLRNPARRSP